jgi:hypothetical protein
MLQKSLKVDVEDETFDLESRPVAAHESLEHIQLVTVLIAGDEVFVFFMCRKQNGFCAHGSAHGSFFTFKDVIVASVGGFAIF